jgi:hypothetical protein
MAQFMLTQSRHYIASKIRDCYVFIAQNFDEGDEICIFGYFVFIGGLDDQPNYDLAFQIFPVCDRQC